MAQRTVSNRFGATFLALVALGVGGAITPAAAETFSWASPVDGSWHDFTAWNPTGVPTSADLATFLADGTYTVAVEAADAETGGFNLFRAGATIEVSPGRELTIADETPFVVGTILVGDPGVSSGSSQLTFSASDTQVSGSGLIRLNSDPSEGVGASVVRCPGNSFQIGSSLTIEGTGTIEGRLQNDGTIRCLGDMLIDADFATNDGTIEAVSNSTLLIDTQRIEQGPTGLIQARNSASLEVTSVWGGTLIATDDAVIKPTEELRNCQVEGRVEFPRAYNDPLALPSLRIEGSLVNEAHFVVFGRQGSADKKLLLTSEEAVTTPISGAGTIMLQGRDGGITGAGLSTTNPLSKFVLGATQTLAGSGRIECLVDLDGILSPGIVNGVVVLDDLTGEINLRSSNDPAALTLASTSQTLLQIAGTATGEFDRVTGDGAESQTTLTLAGSLVLTHIDGFAGLADGEEIAIISEMGAIVGTFDSVQSPEGFEYEVIYAENEVRVRSSGVSSVEDEEVRSGASARLLPSAPNPVTRGAEAQLRFTLESPADVQLDVVDVRGRRVASFEIDGATAGPHVVSWDVRDEVGHPLSSGVYFQRMRVGTEVRQSKIHVVR